MNLLAFETATPRGGVALMVDGCIAGQTIVDGAQSHSSLILAAASELIKTHDVTWDRIDIYTASHGPGSFTGVRVGMSLAKSLAFTTGKKVLTVSSLESIALNAFAGQPVLAVMVLIDARMNEVYGALYRVHDGKLSFTNPHEFCAAPSQAAALIVENTLMAGEGARRYAEIFAGNPLVTLTEGDALLSSPAATAMLALRKSTAIGPQNPADATVVYWRDAIQPPKANS